MKYGIALLCLACLVLGGYLGVRFVPRTELREKTVTLTKTLTVTKEIEKFPDGKIIERTKTQTSDTLSTRPQPEKPQYRAGILMPVGTNQLTPTVTAGRRLLGNVWLDAQYNMPRKEALVGVSIEF